MKKLLFLSLLLSIIIFSCKKDDPIGDSDDAAAKLATVVTIQNELGEHLSGIIPFQGDTLQALRDLGTWLDSKEGVDASYFIDEGMILIDFENGMSTHVRIIPVDANGIHQVRGGGGNGNLTQYSFSKTVATNTIKNEKVLVLNPVLDEFYGGVYGKEKQFEGGSATFDIDVYNDEQVTLDLLNSLGEYGFIILNTHGKPNGFLLKELPDFHVATKNWTKEDVTELMANKYGLPLSKFISGELEMNMHVYYDKSIGVTTYEPNVYVTEKYIRNLNVDLSEAVLFGNTCYSGHTADGPNKNNMPQAWRSRGLATYYGYSYVNDIGIAVDNTFCDRMEDSLISNLAIQTDSTGIAHLKENTLLQFYNASFRTTLRSKQLAVLSQVTENEAEVIINQPLFFNLFFSNDYAYEGCQDTLLDIRDGSVYKTVCIGDQVWMAENLNWGGAGVCYDNNPANCDTYGRLYSLTELTGLVTSTDSTTVQGLCPDDWHVPSKAEYWELIDFCGGFTQAADKLRSATGWPSPHSDEFGFNLLPAGYGYYQGSTSLFFDIGEEAGFWTSTPEAGNYSALIAPYPVIGFDPYNLPETHFSCRCVKD